MADRLFVPRKLWVDLREFGWGIREVPVLSGGMQPGPDSIGSGEIIDGSVTMEDLHAEVKETIEKLKRLVEVSDDGESLRIKINEVT